VALIGYARVSTAEQDTALQTDALRLAGCERIFEDTLSGSTSERPGLSAALAFSRDGDVLVVWRLDRLGRSLPHLIDVVGSLEARGVGFRSLTEAIDTTMSKAVIVGTLLAVTQHFVSFPRLLELVRRPVIVVMVRMILES